MYKIRYDSSYLLSYFFNTKLSGLITNGYYWRDELSLANDNSMRLDSICIQIYICQMYRPF